MLDDFRQKMHDKNKARHEKLCAEGKHDWFVLSNETVEYSYSSVGGCNPSYTEIVRKCSWCGEEERETIGELPEEYYGEETC